MYLAIPQNFKTNYTRTPVYGKHEMQMKVKLAFLLIAIFGIIFIVSLCNAPIIIPLPVQDKSGQFEFTLVQSKGRDFEMLSRHLETYKNANKISEGVMLYRTLEKDYSDLSMWMNYLTNPYWDLEYIGN